MRTATTVHKQKHNIPVSLLQYKITEGSKQETSKAGS
jgi:hypothetical protein